MIGLLFLITTIGTTHAKQTSDSQSGVCPLDVGPSLALITAKNDFQKENLIYPHQLWAAHKDLAFRIWKLFIDKGSLTDDLESCLQPPLTMRYLNHALSEIFFDNSIQNMRQINSDVFDALNKRMNIQNIAFSVFANCQSCINKTEILGPNRPAHFSQAARSIVADVAKLPANDWLVVFIHETGHYFLDDSKWSDFFLSTKNLAAVSALLAGKKDELELKPNEIEFLDQWLLSGIQIKLLAEWRVWAFTLNFISNTTQFQFGQQTEWLNNFHHLPISTKYVELYKSLEKNFQNPTVGFESHPILLQRLGVLRVKLMSQVESGQLDPLDFIKK